MTQWSRKKWSTSVRYDMQERQRAEAARAEQRRYEQQQLADEQNARNEQMAARGRSCGKQCR